MKHTRILTYVLIVIAAFAAGRWFNGTGTVETASSARKAQHYTCPMHPQYVSDRQGDCPSCGMRLVPANADDDSAEMSEAAGSGSSAPGTVRVSMEKQQMIGVSLAPVAKSTGARTLRTLGRVAADETRIYVINATIEGWITSTRPSATGDYVKKDQVLASFYSPEFLSAIQALLFALNSMDRVQVTGKENLVQKDQMAQFSVNLQQYKDSLRNLGMGAVQIEELIKSRKRSENVDITSPANGFILARKVSEGLRFNEGDEMYRIADLSRVWILADIFEHEERYLRPGIRVKTTLPNQGIEIEARVSDALPQFDPETRTLKVRLLADNPGYRLRPEMFVNLEIPVQYPPTLTIPVDAILDSGLKKTVFVDLGNGLFEPRAVQTGWRSGGQVEVLSGLREGERIVVSGTFLIDSESRMKASVAEVAGNTVKDLVCGMDIDEKEARAAGRISIYQNKTYYFCADSCKRSFDKDPKRYIAASLRNANPAGSIEAHHE